tara:strand:- start:104 stop:1597 length:1494 start_codon:yes stop_codon:yes gene_type:complete
MRKLLFFILLFSTCGGNLVIEEPVTTTTSTLTTTSTISKTTEGCPNDIEEEFLSNIEYKIDYETKSFVLNLNGLRPEDFNLYKFKLTMLPIDFAWELSQNGEPIPRSDIRYHQGGFGYYNTDVFYIPVDKDISSTDLNISIGSYNFGYGDASWDKSGYKSKVDIGLKFEILCEGVGFEPEPIHLIIEKEKYTIENTEPFFVEDIFKPYDLNNFNKEEIDTDSYNAWLAEFEELKKRNSEIPAPSEAAVALMGLSIEPNPNYTNSYNKFTWKNHRYENSGRRDVKTVIGMYGDVKKSDLETLSKVLEMLNIVAPGLDISYSQKTSDVTLPIHFINCPKTKAAADNCEALVKAGEEYGLDSPAGGVHMMEDFIIIDSSQENWQRKQTIVHELGHALGLVHNVCPSGSVMSYDFSDRTLRLMYLDYLDLMQLAILYNPLMEEDGNNIKYSNVPGKEFVPIDKIIDLFNLSKEKIEEYQQNPDTICGLKPPGYKFLIDIQK